MLGKYFHIEDETGKMHRYTSPLSWHTLNERDLLIWAGITLQNLTLDFALRTALMLLCGIPEKFFFRLTDEQLSIITPRIQFLFGKNQLTRWVITEFKHRGVIYYGPADCLSNIKIKEFRRTEIYYQLYNNTRDPKYLRLLTATLYRPYRDGIIDDDKREDLNEHSVFKRADLFAGVKLGRIRFRYLQAHFLQAVLLNYEGCRNLIHDHYPTVFVKGPGKKSEKVYDLEELIDTIAGGALGDAIQTENIKVYRFFTHLEKQIETADKLKRK